MLLFPQLNPVSERHYSRCQSPEPLPATHTSVSNRTHCISVQLLPTISAWLFTKIVLSCFNSAGPRPVVASAKSAEPSLLRYFEVCRDMFLFNLECTDA
jgi:hypothetical protein